MPNRSVVPAVPLLALASLALSFAFGGSPAEAQDSVLASRLELRPSYAALAELIVLPGPTYTSSDRHTRRRFAGLTMMGATLSLSIPAGIAALVIEGTENSDYDNQLGTVIGVTNLVLGVVGVVTLIAASSRLSSLPDAPPAVRRRHRRRLVPAGVLIGLAWAAVAVTSVVGSTYENS